MGGGGEQASAQLEAKTEAPTKKPYCLVGSGNLSAVPSIYEGNREPGAVTGATANGVVENGDNRLWRLGLFLKDIKGATWEADIGHGVSVKMGFG